MAAAPALEKGLDIIELLSQKNNPMLLREVATELSRSKNELFRIVNVLIERGYLQRNSDDMISLTNKMLEIGLRSPKTHSLVALASPIVHDLAMRVKNSVYLAVSNLGKIVVVAAASGIEDVNFSLKLGYRRPLLKSHSGLVILAFQTDIARQLILDGNDVAKAGVNLTDELQHQLNEIRANGYLVSPSLDTLGVTDIVVPVFSDEGQPIAALAVNHLNRRSESEDKYKEVLGHLRTASAQLTEIIINERNSVVV